MRTYQYDDRPCDHCRRAADDPERGPALWVTDARPLDFGVPGMIFEANPGEPVLCDDCEGVRRVKKRVTPR